VNLTANPPRVKPRTIIDAAVGYEYYSGDRRTWEIVAQVSNLTDQTALYNFQSVFVGTRVVQPRSVSIKIRRHW
jgi:outer membrane receptor protein involved in Fe transport